MAAPILTTGSTVLCPHGGTVTHVPGQVDMTVDGQPALLLTDMGLVAGCPFVVPGQGPSPCLSVRWLTGAALTRVRGVPVLLQTSTGLCMNAQQVPQGPPLVASVQARAGGV